MSDTRVILIALICLAAAPRIQGALHYPFWFDEAVSYRMVSTFDIPDMIARTERDVHPPGYYLFLKGWAAIFGDSVLALRASSVFLSLACMPLLFAITRRLDEPESETVYAGLVACALYAVCPVLVVQAWSARMYPLAMLLILGSSYCLLRALEDKRWWAGYICLTSAGLYTHNVLFLSTAAQLLYLATRKGRFLSSLGLGACIAVSYWPWAGSLAYQRAAVRKVYWAQPTRLDEMLNAASGLFRLPVFPSVWLWIPVFLTIAGVLVMALQRPGKASFLAWLGLVPPGLFVLQSFWEGSSLLQARYLVPSLLFCWLALGFLAARFWTRSATFVILAVTLGGLLYNTTVYTRGAADPALNWPKQLEATLLYNRGQTDPIVVNSPLIYLSLKRMFPTAQMILMTDEDIIDHWHGGAFLVNQEQRPKEELAGIRGRRLWMVNNSGFSWPDRITASPPWQRVQAWEFRGFHAFQGKIELELYQR